MGAASAHADLVLEFGGEDARYFTEAGDGGFELDGPALATHCWVTTKTYLAARNNPNSPRANYPAITKPESHCVFRLKEAAIVQTSDSDPQIRVMDTDAPNNPASWIIKALRELSSTPDSHPDANKNGSFVVGRIGGAFKIYCYDYGRSRSACFIQVNRATIASYESEGSSADTRAE